MFCHQCGVQLVDGAKFCGNCGTRLGAAATAIPTAPASPPPASSPARAAEPAKILDAGDRFVISGDDAVEVEKILQKYLGRGAKLITPVSKVGRNWAAACTIPPKTHNMDETQTLNLQEVVDAAAARAADEVDDGCRVEEFGFKRIVYGPSLIAVKIRLARMKQFGAEVIGDIEVQEEEWVAVVDVGSEKNTGFRW